MRLDTLPEDMAGLTVERPSTTFQCLQSPDPVRPPLFDEYLRAELANDEGNGTAEFRAWLQRARERHAHHLVPT